MDIKKVTSLVLAQLFLFSNSFAARPMAADEKADLENAPTVLSVAKKSDPKDNKVDVDSEVSDTKENLNEPSAKSEEPKVAPDEIDKVETVSLEELQQEMQKISKQLNDLHSARVSSSKELNDSLQQLSEQFTKQLENDSKDGKLSTDDINKLQEVLAQIKDIHTPEKPKSFFSKVLGFFGNGILLPFKMVIDGLHITVAFAVPCLIIYGSIVIYPKLVKFCDEWRANHGGRDSSFASFGSQNKSSSEIEMKVMFQDPLNKELEDNDARLAQFSNASSYSTL